MKIDHTSSKKRLLIPLAIASVVILASVGIGVYALQQQQSSSKESDTSKTGEDTRSSTDEQPVNLDPPTDEEIKTGNDTKEQSVNPSGSPSPQPDTNANLSVTANNTGSSIQIRTSIAASISEGSCTLTLTKGSSTVTKQNVGIQPLSGYSTCKGWDIPLSELSSGTWSVRAVASYQSTLASGTAEVIVP